jgi:tetratricopeptide (TPR) repeat protein
MKAVITLLVGFLLIPGMTAVAAPLPNEAVTGNLPDAATTGDFQSQIQQSIALRDAGTPAAALALIEPLAIQNPENWLLLAALADTLEDLEQPQRALTLYQKVVFLDPQNIGSRTRLAELLLGQNQKDSALEQYFIIAAARPFDPLIRKRTADLLIEADRTDAAIVHLEAYLKAVPNDDAAMRTLHSLYLWNDKLEDAMRVLKLLVERNPGDIGLERQLAERYLDQGNEKEAIKHYSRVVKADRQDAAALSTLGMLYEWNSMPAEALKAYEQYLVLRPFDSEIRVRALTLSSDMGLGRKARLHAQMVRAGDPRYADLARDIVISDTGFNSYVAMDYTFYNENGKFRFHQVGPRVSIGVTDWASVGAYYNFRYHEDLARTTQKPVMGHQIGAFASLNLPAGIMLTLDGSYIYYDTGRSSGNAGLTLSKEFENLTLTAFFERKDILSSMGDIIDSVVSNDIGLAIYTSPWDRMIVTAEISGGVYDDNNSHVAGTVGLGVRIVRSPSLELMYNYTIEHFKFDAKANNLSYFAPDLYHVHGPQLTFTHPVNHWFTYGLMAEVLHAYGYGDNALLFSGRAEFIFRPGLHHLIKTSYQGTVEMWGKAASGYQDNLLLFRYAYEF